MEDARRVFNKMAIQDMVSWTAMIFGHIIQTHYESVVFVGNNLVNMYAKCGSMADGWTLFSKMHSHNENTLQIKFLNWTLEIEQAMECYQISMLLLASGISVQMFNGIGCNEKKQCFIYIAVLETGHCIWAHQHTTGTPICIFKNLRICRDCHTSTKFISKIVKRAIHSKGYKSILAYDFEDGVCTCRNYW
ncbi:unnamed protein product [Sphagnum troendelagicum]|uniref:DYW domain-containing protein n=1 Tax=Sphagnum troendelagicum TaxID=128251 RepID=A0ABP0V1Z7_9BRYO